MLFLKSYVLFNQSIPFFIICLFIYSFIHSFPHSSIHSSIDLLLYLYISTFSLLQTSHSAPVKPSPPSHTSFAPSSWRATFYYPTTSFFGPSTPWSPCQAQPSVLSKSTSETSLFLPLSLVLSLLTLLRLELLQILLSLNLALLPLLGLLVLRSLGLVQLFLILSLSVLLILSSPGLVLLFPLPLSLLFRLVLHH